MKKPTGFISFFIILLALQLQAQTPAIDSLKDILSTRILTEKERVDILNSIAYEHYDYNDSIGLAYSQRALAEAQKIKYAGGIKRAYTMVGLGYFSVGRFSDAIKAYHNSDSVIVEGLNALSIYNLTLLGKIYKEKSSFDSAMFFFHKAKKLFNKKDDLREGTILYKNIAQLKFEQWQIQEALTYLDSAMLFNHQLYGTYSAADIAQAYSEIYLFLMDFEKANYHIENLCKVAESRSDPYYKIQCHISKSDMAQRKGNLGDALLFALDALQEVENYFYAPQAAKVYRKVAAIYEALQQDELAYTYYYKALDINEKLGLKKELALTYSQLMGVYNDLGNTALALEFNEKAGEIYRSIGDRKGEGIYHNAYGLILLKQAKFNQAIAQFEKALSIGKELNYVFGTSRSTHNLARVYEASGDILRAKSYMEQALNLYLSIQDNLRVGQAYAKIAQLLIKLNQDEGVEHYLNKLDSLSKYVNSNELAQEIAITKSTYYEKIGDFKTALTYNNELIKLKEEAYVESAAKKLSEMQAIYTAEKREKEIELLRQERQLQDQKLAMQQNRLYLLAGMVSIAGIALFIISYLGIRTYQTNRNLVSANKHISEQNEEIQTQSEELRESNEILQKLNREITEQKEEIQAQSEELIEANETISRINENLEETIEKRTTELKQAYKELDIFFYRSSHDFRRPLTTLLGLAEVARITVKDAYTLELFEKVSETALALDKMLVKLQSISDLGTQELVYKEIYLDEVMHSVIDEHTKQLNEKGIKVIYENKLSKSFHSYPALIKIILENIIENSIQFCGYNEPYIKITAEDNQQGIDLKFEDNGQGIKQELQNRIFDMYFRANEKSKGNGLGLYVAKRAADKINGAITFNSTYGKGSTFTVHLKNQNTAQVV